MANSTSSSLVIHHSNHTHGHPVAADVVVDALPYYDSGYDEAGVREAALSLVEDETRRYKPTKNYLEQLGQPLYHSFETEIMKAEFERLSNRLPMEMLSMKRYELPAPPPGKQTDFTAWNECVENSYAQLEHQQTRILNLELLWDYGANTWKIYNTTLQTMLEQAQKQLLELRKRIQEINFNRKNEQAHAGDKLSALEQTWVGLVGKNYEIECAIAELEKEVVHLRQQDNSQNMIRFGWINSLLGALLVSLSCPCCFLQIFFNLFGIGCAGLNNVFTPYRAIFISLTVISLSYSYYRYRPSKWTFTLVVLFTLSLSLSSDILRLYQKSLPVNEQLDTNVFITHWQITGMHCESCRLAASRSLERINGVLSVNVELDTGQADVITRVPIEDHLIVEAVQSAGFEVYKII